MITVQFKFKIVFEEIEKSGRIEKISKLANRFKPDFFKIPLATLRKRCKRLRSIAIATGKLQIIYILFQIPIPTRRSIAKDPKPLQ